MLTSQLSPSILNNWSSPLKKWLRRGFKKSYKYFLLYTFHKTFLLKCYSRKQLCKRQSSFKKKFFLLKFAHFCLTGSLTNPRKLELISIVSWLNMKPLLLNFSLFDFARVQTKNPTLQPFHYSSTNLKKYM